MSLEKILQKVQSDIRELTPTLEAFFEDTIQPSVSDCEKLQQQLTLLQENLAVYKYQKLNHELSPSFNLHAKISEKELPEEKTAAPAPEPKKEPVHEEKPHVEEVKLPPAEEQNKTTHRGYPKLTINLNDKFRFINELFAQNNAEYGIALEQLNNLRNWGDTELYLNSLKSLYGWNNDKDIVKYFYALVKKRFE